MALSAMFLLVLGQEVGAPTKHVATDSAVPLVVAEPVRLAISPRLDGVLSDEEWDAFADVPSSRYSFQWEPGKFHVAGVVPSGHDLVFSADLKGDGWLNGKDNLEVRIGNRGAKVVVQARWLDASAKAGPVWVPAPTVAQGSAAAAQDDQEETTFEATIVEAGPVPLPIGPGSKLAVRFDTLEAGAPDPEAFLPRSVAEVSLASMRHAGMPKGLRVQVENGWQTVTPGDSFRTRFGFNGDNTLQLQRFDLRSEGAARDFTSLFSVPFPNFDKKNRAFVDYSTKVAPSATTGFRLIRGMVTAGDGVQGIVQASYRVAPLVDFSIRNPLQKSVDVVQKIKLSVSMKSNSTNRVLGGVAIDLPEGWRNLSTGEKGFIIYRKGATHTKTVDLEIPANTEGTFPLVFRSVLGDTMTEQVGYVTFAK